MSTTYHTPLVANSEATATNLNNPFGDLDSAIDDFLNGSTAISKLAFTLGSNLTIQSGKIVVTDLVHQVLNESAVASDNLDIIEKAEGIDFLILRQANVSQDIVIRHKVGNIATPSGENITLDDFDKQLLLYFDSYSNLWTVIAGSPVESEELTYTPNSSANWTFFTITPTDVLEALDRLSEQLNDADYSFTPSVASNWRITIADQQTAIHELADRLTDVRELGSAVFSGIQLTIPDISWTSLTFNRELSDRKNMFSFTNPTRLTATEDGIYLISGSIEWEHITGTERLVRFRKNGTTEIFREPFSDSGGSSPYAQSVWTIEKLLSGDYIEFQVYHDSTGSVDIINNNRYSPYFSLVKMASV